MAEGNDQTTTTAVAAATAAAATSTTATAPKSKTKTNWQEVQDTVSRLASHTGVLAVSIFNAEGDIVTQQMTPAGEALQSSKMKKKEKMSSHNQSKQSSSSDDDDTEINHNNNNNNVLGNPKLLTKMMKNANLYVQSLSGHTSMNTADEDNTINVDEEENSNANNSNSKSNSTTVEDISFVRIRTQYDEILIAPKLGYTLVVLQDPSVSSL
eukprot:CAMPEP_0170915164 /NCGR_PEP_ID=MMETSP0735-20130129/6038_1 /TAXON_ID=186038 /ORGANISM="Fragilariopsis kerguelensis, Strain L26-C5" /LENGTH=210 /DNA_ID=CAMNT_0011313027 /DNA_START=13 /DNA_END=645 /DNA_ORIENTATION=-